MNPTGVSVFFRNQTGKKKSIQHVSLISIILAAYSSVAAAGAHIKVNESSSIDIGVSSRMSFTHISSPGPGQYENKFNLDSVRLLTNTHINKNLALTINTERDPATGDVTVLDAAAKLSMDILPNVWMGRFVTPVDRANLSGSYFANSYDYPFVSAYPTLVGGRNDGVTVWGQPGEGRFTYYAGAFQGVNTPGSQNANGRYPLYVGRLNFDFWDPEPGYFTQSMYYTPKNILAVGLAAARQNGIYGTASSPGNFTGWNVDVFVEKNLNAGIPTLDAAYYRYNTNDKALDAQGKAYFVTLGYLFNHKIGAGKIQPIVRYQRFNEDSGIVHKRTDVGANYVIDGHRNRVSAVFYNDDTGTLRYHAFKVGYQIIF